MKRNITLLLALCSLLSFGQNYALFNENSKKVFRSPDSLSTSYSLVFDTTFVTGSTTFFYPYKLIGNLITPNYECQPFGGECYLRDSSIWIGPIIARSGSQYSFNTSAGSQVNFNFELEPSESQIFYQDDSQKFSISRVTPLDTIDFGGFTDSVKRFQVSHTDLQGNPINSALNNWQIVIGKELGLVNFFRIDSFPQLLVPLALMGNENPDAGMNKLTNEILYDHQPGDEIQYYHYSSHGLPSYSFKVYSKHIFLERDETADSLIYRIRKEDYYPDSSIVKIDTAIVKYYKHDYVKEIPFDFHEYYNYSKLYLKDYCGLQLWTQHLYDYNALFNCESNIWCSYGETITWNYNTYVGGLGVYESVSMDPRPEGWSSGNVIVYFKKGNIECGDEVIGLPERPLRVNNLVICPNPANNYFMIRSDDTNEYTLEIVDLKGIKIFEEKHFRPNKEVDISKLCAGIYLVRLINDSISNSGKLIVR